MTGDVVTGGNRLRHNGFPAHWAGNDGLADFSGLRKGGWPRGDAEVGTGLTQRANVRERQVAPHPARSAGRAGRRAKKEQGQRPCSVDQAGISVGSVFAPTTHSGQTSQTGAEEEHGAGFRHRITTIS